MIVVSQFLRNHGLRVTPSRQAVLQVFATHGYALSHADIERLLGNRQDRVTLYRTLRSFLDNGLIHAIPDERGTPYYALCQDSCTREVHQHEHLHFRCRHCGHTACIESVVIAPVALPAGYASETWSVLVEGLCPKCSQKGA